MFFFNFNKIIELILIRLVIFEYDKSIKFEINKNDKI